MSKKVKFTVHTDCNGEWVLRVNHPNGSYAGLGSINATLEASLIARTMNAAVREDEVISDKWIDYFENTKGGS